MEGLQPEPNGVDIDSVVAQVVAGISNGSLAANGTATVNPSDPTLALDITELGVTGAILVTPSLTESVHVTRSRRLSQSPSRPHRYEPIVILEDNL